MIDDFINKAKKVTAKRAKKLEVDIEGEFVTYAKNKKCIAIKLVLVNLMGFPDRTILCPGGRVFFIEFKRTNNDKQSINQKKWEQRLTNLGFKYHVCWNINHAKKLLDDLIGL